MNSQAAAAAAAAAASLVAVILNNMELVVVIIDAFDTLRRGVDIWDPAQYLSPTDTHTHTHTHTFIYRKCDSKTYTYKVTAYCI